MHKTLSKVLSCFAFLCLLTVSVSPAAAAPNVNNFVIQNYHIEYFLSQDGQGRSSLITVETIDAVFPEIDQNHGIERAVPAVYDGHPTGLQFTSVTDANGNALMYSTRDTNNNEILRIGSADRYVHGLQSYKIVYAQSDVTKYFGNTNDDEFYWDTNGTEWAVPIKALNVDVHIDDKLAKALTHKQQCYIGQAGSSNTCVITPTKDGFSIGDTSLNPYENISIAIGFNPHTFTVYKVPPIQKFMVVWVTLIIISVLSAFIVIIWLVWQASRRSNRLAEIKTIIPEYLPPKDVSVSTAGGILNKTNKVFTAQLIDLAVRHYIKIYQTREKSFFRRANFELEIVQDVSTLKAEEREILNDLFGAPSVGARLDMGTLRRNRAIGLLLSDNQTKVASSILGQYALRARNDVQSAWFKRVARNLFILGIVTLSPWFIFPVFVSLIIAWVLKPLTDKGLELVRYLKGLEMYIKVAETDRLRMLQSPEGAAKLDAPVDTNDKRQLIKLYERVLPYAILFGQEKDWNKQLGQYYESVNESPSWYSGNNAVFNAAVFSSAISNFNQVATYSDPSSSSSGGSGGGGSSGGGGGGGGGGGW